MNQTYSHWCRCIFIVRKDCVDDLHLSCMKTFLQTWRLDRTASNAPSTVASVEGRPLPFHSFPGNFPAAYISFVADSEVGGNRSLPLSRHAQQQSRQLDSITHDNNTCLLTNLTSLYVINSRPAKSFETICFVIVTPLIDNIIRLAYKIRMLGEESRMKIGRLTVCQPCTCEIYIFFTRFSPCSTIKIFWTVRPAERFGKKIGIKWRSTRWVLEYLFLRNELKIQYQDTKANNWTR